MQHELSSGFEDCDSEETSGHFHNNNSYNCADMDQSAQVFDRGKCLRRTQDEFTLPACHENLHIVRRSSFGNTAFTNLEMRIKLLKNESKMLQEQIKLLGVSSDSKTSVPNETTQLDSYKGQVTAVKNDLHKLDELLHQVETHQDEKDVQISKLLLIFKTLNLTKNFMQDKLSDCDHSSQKENMEKKLQNLERNVAAVKEAEVTKRNEMEAEYMERISKLQLSEVSLQEQLAERISQINNLQKSATALEFIAELYNNQDKNESEVVKKALDDKILAEKKLFDVEDELKIKCAEHEAQIKFLQRELKEQIEERQKNDYRTIFLEDQVAMLNLQNKKLKEPLGLQAGLNESFSKDASSNNGESHNANNFEADSKFSINESQKLEKDDKMFKLQSSLEMKEHIIEDLLKKLEKINLEEVMENQIKYLADKDGKDCDKLHMACNQCKENASKISKLEFNLSASENCKLELEQKITHLFQEKADLAARICEAGRINSHLKQQLKEQEQQAETKFNNEICQARHQNKELLDQCTNQEKKLVGLEFELLSANHKTETITAKTDMLESTCQKLEKRSEELSHQLADALGSQKEISLEQSLNIKKLLSLHFSDTTDVMSNGKSIEISWNEMTKTCNKTSDQDFNNKEAFEKKLIRSSEYFSQLENTIQKLEDDNKELLQLLTSHKTKIMFLEQQLFSQKQKFSDYQQDKKANIDKIIRRQSFQKMRLHQSLDSMKIKHDFSERLNNDLSDQLNRINDQMKCNAEKLTSIEAHNISLASALKEKELLLQIKVAELEQLQKTYGDVNNRFEDLKLQITELKIHNFKLNLDKKECASTGPQCTKEMQKKLNTLYELCKQQNKPHEHGLINTQNNTTSVTSSMELEFLRSENARLNNSLEARRLSCSVPGQADDIESLINRSHRRALSALSINSKLATSQSILSNTIGSPLRCSSPVMSSNETQSFC